MSQDALDKDKRADAVDRIVQQWREVRPDLNVTAKEVTGRIVRLNSLLQRRFGEAFAPSGLAEGNYGVLAALRRSGEPFELTPTELARQQMMSSGGMTPVVDRLEKLGLVERVENPNDRRGRLVRLTQEGRERVDEAMEAHIAAEHHVVASLSAKEQERLADLLRTMLLAIDEVEAD